MRTNSKHWYESKTLWINGLLVIVAVATYAGQGQLGIILDADNSQLALAIAGIANIILRLITTQPVRLQ